MGHFARDCTQDANLTRAIGKLHHTLEAETPVVKSLLTEFFNKLMRVQRKHDIVQAKLKKERQQGKGGAPGAADPNLKAPPPVGKARGTNPPPKGEKMTLPKKIGKVSESERKGEAPTCDTPNNKEGCSERGCGNRGPIQHQLRYRRVGQPPYRLRAGRCHRRNLGGGTGTRRGTSMTIKARGGNSKMRGGEEGKILNIRLEWGYRGAYSSRTKWCEVFSS